MADIIRIDGQQMPEDSTVVTFNGETTLDIPVDRVLDGAKGLSVAMVIGLTEKGTLHVASSSASTDRALAMVARAQKLLLSLYDPQ